MSLPSYENVGQLWAMLIAYFIFIVKTDFKISFGILQSAPCTLYNVQTPMDKFSNTVNLRITPYEIMKF